MNDQDQKWVLFAPMGSSYLGDRMTAVEKPDALTFQSKKEAEGWYQSQDIKPRTMIIAVPLDEDQTPLYVQ